MLEKTVEITILYDYYGNLLTAKQQEIVNLYYFHDLSLGEVSEKLKISRQGVYDHLQRAEKALHDYEDNLGLVEKFKHFSKRLDELYEFVDDSDISVEHNNFTEEILDRIENIQDQI